MQISSENIRERTREGAGHPEQEATLAPSRQRKIIHIDMDAFFASVEQRDNPELRGKPVAVGYPHARGVVAAASYEARKFGVYSALLSVTAKRKCPELIFVPPRFDVYKSVSREIHEIFALHTKMIEPLSLDEAYLDVTENLQGIASATRIAEDIRLKIRERTGLTASAGISYNKFLAKLASDHRKPDGLFVITPAMGPAFAEALPIKKFHGVGPATAGKMQSLGIETGLDLKAQTLPFLMHHFGKAGHYYYWIARGLDDREVSPDRARKSIGAETTFAQDIRDRESANRELRPLIEKLWGHCESVGTRGKTLTLKVKYADFRQLTRSRTSEAPLSTRHNLEQVCADLLNSIFPSTKDVRLLGLSLSSLSGPDATEEEQLLLPI
jgi:DNA polymerase-4